MGFVPPPQPMMQPGMPMQPPMMGAPLMGAPMMGVQMQQPVQPQQTQVVTTTTTQDLGADGKPGTTWSRKCFLIILTIIFAATAKRDKIQSEEFSPPSGIRKSQENPLLVKSLLPALPCSVDVSPSGPILFNSICVFLAACIRSLMCSKLLIAVL